MLINTKYEGFYGSVERVGPYSIRTLFDHFMGIPLWPQDSYVVQGSGLFGRDMKVTEIKRHRGSVRAGFLRWKFWPELIVRPELGDLESLAMGLTLTRLSVAAPQEGRDPQTLAPLHEHLWQRLKQMGAVGAPLR